MVKRQLPTKTDTALPPTATGTSCPEVKRLQVKNAIGDELLHQCGQYKATQRVKVEHQCVKKGRRTGLRRLNLHLVPKDAINAFDLRPHKNKLRNKPRGFPGSTGPPGFCSTKQQMSNLYYGNCYTFLKQHKLNFTLQYLRRL